jgi:hypothetical protein
MQMGTFTRESGKMIYKMMWMPCIYITMETNILVSFKMEGYKATENFRFSTMVSMKESFKMEKWMDLERWILKMGLYMKGNGWMIRFMGKEEWFNRAWIYSLKENFRIIKNKGLGYWQISV